jgi:hypothetical protein
LPSLRNRRQSEANRSFPIILRSFSEGVRKIKARDNISMLLARKRKYSRKNKKGGATPPPLPAPVLAAPVLASAPVHGGIWDIITPITNLVTNAAIKGTTTLTKMAADTIGVDTTKNDLPGALHQVTEVINNPETQDEIKKAAKTLATDASIFVEELEPSLDEMGENVITLAKKESKAGISALKDVTEEIPGVATFYVLNDVVKAAEAGIDAAVKTSEVMSDTITNTENKIEEMKKMGETNLTSLTNATDNMKKMGESNLNALQKQGLDAQKRIESSTTALTNTDDLKNAQLQKLNNMKDRILKNQSMDNPVVTQDRGKMAAAGGGGSRKYKNKKFLRISKTRKSKMSSKTKRNKRVRFSM